MLSTLWFWNPEELKFKKFDYQKMIENGRKCYKSCDKTLCGIKEKVTGIKFATIQNLICSRNLKLQIAVSDKNLIETYFV